MTTRTGRQYRTQQTHYLRKRVSFNSAASGVQVFVGTLPKGAMVNTTLFSIDTAFNAGTTNQLDVGTAAQPSALAANASVNAGVAGFTGVAPATLAGQLAPTGEVDLYARYTQSGTAATAGSVVIVVVYYPDNDG